MAAVGLLFASDFHGDEGSWRAFLRTGARLGAGVLVYGGDYTPYSVAIGPFAGGAAEVSPLRRRCHAQMTPPALVERYRASGVAAALVDADTLVELEGSVAGDRRAWHAFVARRTEAQLRRWCALAAAVLPPAALLAVVPGNHDPLQLDDLLRRQSGLCFLDGDVCPLPGGFSLLGVGWTNRTPLRSPRECDEDELRARIAAAAAAVPDPDAAVFCLHCPPAATRLDRARPRGREAGHVGSTAVRQAIEAYQPLLSLHGHIHESAGQDHLGRTVCLNPGSQAPRGADQGYLVQLRRGEVPRVEAVVLT